MPSDLRPLRRQCRDWQQSRQSAGPRVAVVGAKAVDFLVARRGRLGSFRLRLCVKPPSRSGILVLFLPFLGSFCITNPTCILPNNFMSTWIRVFHLGSFGKNRISYREFPCQPPFRRSPRACLYDPCSHPNPALMPPNLKAHFGRFGRFGSFSFVVLIHSCCARWESSRTRCGNVLSLPQPFL
jgi:hypothetical protein